MKILIAGLGSIGRRHLRNLRVLGESDFVLYRTGRSTLPDDDELRGIPVESSLTAALGHRPQAAIVANPTSLHLDVAIPAAAAGCHLFLEKPISHTVEGIDLLYSALRDGGGNAYVAFQFRFHPTLRICRELISDGAIGQPLSARVHWGEYLPDWHPWENFRESYAAREDLGGGVLLTLCHPFDYLRWIFGEVRTLSASAVPALHLGLTVDSCAEVGLVFDSGLLASVHVDFIQRPTQHSLFVVGTDGTLEWNAVDGSLVHTTVGADVLKRWNPAPEFERNTMFIDEMRHFLATIRGESSPVSNLQDGVRALEIVSAARKMAGFGI